MIFCKNDMMHFFLKKYLNILCMQISVQFTWPFRTVGDLNAEAVPTVVGEDVGGEERH